MIRDTDFYSYKFYLFDLDNTLYDETKYLFEVYYRIAEDYSINAEEIIKLFRSDGRVNLFNKIIIRNNLPVDCLQNFLQILRHVKLPQKINLIPTISILLGKLLDQNKELFVVTNGNVEQQKNKIAQINWRGLESKIHFIYANSIDPKPSVTLFKHMKKEFSIIVEKTIMIGDSEIDEEFARNSNIAFIHVSGLPSYI